MKIKVSETTKTQLDWLVAKCLQVKVNIQHGACYYWVTSCQEDVFKPSTDWSQGGPILEREGIATLCPETKVFWDARDTKTFTMNPVYWRGPTLLIAAMRCYVASKLGDKVEVPEELGAQP